MRKPINQMKSGRGPRQLLWERMRERMQAGQEFTLADIVIGGESIKTAQDYALGLINAGYLKVVSSRVLGGGKMRPAQLRLVRDHGCEAPRVRRDGTAVTQGLAQEQMWRTLRMSTPGADLNARELAGMASTTHVRVSPVAARDYLQNLHRAGYMECTQTGHGTWRGGIPARYRLVSNTGPLPPMVCRSDSMFDPNLGKEIWRKTVDVADWEEACHGH